MIVQRYLFYIDLLSHSHEVKRYALYGFVWKIFNLKNVVIALSRFDFSRTIEMN